MQLPDSEEKWNELTQLTESIIGLMRDALGFFDGDPDLAYEAFRRLREKIAAYLDSPEIKDVDDRCVEGQRLIVDRLGYTPTPILKATGPSVPRPRQ
jgi:hypothetical protein